MRNRRLDGASMVNSPKETMKTMRWHRLEDGRRGRSANGLQNLAADWGRQLLVGALLGPVGLPLGPLPWGALGTVGRFPNGA